jgi:plastocyanin
MTHRTRLVLFAAAVAAMLASPAAAFAQTKLIAEVGQNDSFQISLRTEAGAAVTDLPAGAYDIEIRDHSELHNFHLTGPGGVNASTTLDFVGTRTVQVTLQDKARYTFLCDAHPTSMRGTFTTGGGPPTSPPPPPKPKVKTLTATVGPGRTISLRSGTRRVSRLTAGRYRIVVRDRSKMHNFHLRGPGVNKRTTVGFSGTATWTVTLRRGRYTFVCDPHRAVMKGSFRVT